MAPFHFDAKLCIEIQFDSILVFDLQHYAQCSNNINSVESLPVPLTVYVTLSPNLNLKDLRYINLPTLFYSHSSSEFLKSGGLYLANMILVLFTGENITYSVYTIPKYFSTWHQSLQLLSFTVNSLEHILSITCCLPPCRLQFCMRNMSNWPVIIQ